ncbi:MAG: RNA methyltransferase [Chitinophagaceae bacterium]|nr:RNA methyltransferase [Chitinophagaceae bacterium]
MIISSIQNPKIKYYKNLAESKERRKNKHFIVEGIREISLALKKKWKIHTLFLCEEIYKPDDSYPITIQNTPIISITPTVFAKIAYRENSQGVAAIFEYPSWNISHIPIASKKLLYLVLENIEKPGNIGALFRTADAAGVDGIFISDEQTDILNPNAIRSSMGCVFTVPFVIESQKKIYTFLKEKNITIFTTDLKANNLYTQCNLKENIALVFGSEAEGISSFWKKNADKTIKIQMMGEIDSLNVSVSASIIIYEALRQRNSNYV